MGQSKSVDGEDFIPGDVDPVQVLPKLRSGRVVAVELVAVRHPPRRTRLCHLHTPVKPADDPFSSAVPCLARVDQGDLHVPDRLDHEQSLSGQKEGGPGAPSASRSE